MSFILRKRVWRYQRDNQNPYIEEEQRTQWSREKVQKDRQRSTKYTHKTKDRVARTSPRMSGDVMEYVICFSAVCLGFQQLVQCPFLCIPTQDLLFLFLISSFGFLYCVFPIVCGSVVICLLMNYRYDREKSLKVPRG